jgi:hypothetical protein
VRYAIIIKLATTVLLLCACRASQPIGEPRPNLAEPPDRPMTAAPPDSAALPEFPAFPAIAPPPVSHPTGDPITVPVAAPAVGDVMRQRSASTFEQHYVDGGITRFRRTERTFDLRVEVLEVEADHPSKIELTADVATETVAPSSSPATTPRKIKTLLVGKYVVAPGKGGGFERDKANVSRPGGPQISVQEQVELGSMFGELLRGGAPIVRFFKSTHLHLGEAIVLNEEAKHAIAGPDSLPGTFTLSVIAATAMAVTYQLDVESKGPHPDASDTWLEVRGQATMTFDRATGRQLEQREQSHHIERRGTTVDDTFSTSTDTIEPIAK